MVQVFLQRNKQEILKYFWCVFISFSPMAGVHSQCSCAVFLLFISEIELRLSSFLFPVCDDPEDMICPYRITGLLSSHTAHYGRSESHFTTKSKVKKKIQMQSQVNFYLYSALYKAALQC